MGFIRQMHTVLLILSCFVFQKGAGPLVFLLITETKETSERPSFALTIYGTYSRRPHGPVSLVVEESFGDIIGRL